MRIQKFLSRAGVASRRKAEVMVLDGRVRVNGAVVTELGTTVDPNRDHVEADGTPVRPPEARWIRFHKPAGVLCTAVDTHGRRTIYDLLPGEYGSLRYVGRLDLDTEGLLLLTNDGDVANRLQHPRLPGRARIRGMRRRGAIEEGHRPSSRRCHARRWPGSPHPIGVRRTGERMRKSHARDDRGP